MEQADSKTGSLGIITTTLELAVNWGRKYSMWPLLFGLACCAIEQITSGSSRFDISRFGARIASPGRLANRLRARQQ